jgi:Tfp pilus assembly protein PilE
MELLIVVAVLCLLGLLAMHYGCDSQYRLRSREEEAAALGLTWDARDWRAPREPSTTPAR